MRKLLLLLLGCTIITLNACKKDKKEDPAVQQNVLNANAFIVDTTEILKADENSFTLRKNNIKHIPVVGDIILAAPSQNCPYGMLRKVTSVQDINGQYFCGTEQSSLNEAFEELHISSVESNAFEIYETAKMSPLDISINYKDAVSGLEIKGKIKFNFEKPNIKIEKKKGALDLDSMVIAITMNTLGSSLEVTNSNSTFKTKDTSLKKIELPPLTLIIPIAGPLPFPLPIKLKQQIDLRVLPFSIGGKFKLQVLPECSATLGCKYKNGQWSNLSSLTVNANSPSIFTKSDFLSYGGVSAKLVIFNPVYELHPYYLDNLKFFVSLANSLNLDIGLTKPNILFKYKMDATGGLKLKFWNGKEDQYAITANIIEKTITEKNWEDTAILSGKWKISSYIHNGEEAYGDGYPICMGDNIYYFISATEVVDDEGPTKCESGDPQIREYNYSINKDTTLFVYKYGSSDLWTLNIISLTDKELKLEPTDLLGDLITYTRLP